MKVDAATGLLDQARKCPSPNCDARPDPEDIAGIVIHGISLPPGEFGGDAVDCLFTNCLDAEAHPSFREIAGLRVSAHVLIRRDGALVQYVPFTERAWHAGESHWGHRTACNDFTVGIELEGTDDQAYEEIQYVRLAAIVAALASAYPRITPGRVVGHSTIAPGRKTDPGPSFDWTRLAEELGVSPDCFAPELPQ